MLSLLTNEELRFLEEVQYLLDATLEVNGRGQTRPALAPKQRHPTPAQCRGLQGLCHSVTASASEWHRVRLENTLCLMLPSAHQESRQIKHFIFAQENALDELTQMSETRLANGFGPEFPQKGKNSFFGKLPILNIWQKIQFFFSIYFASQIKYNWRPCQLPICKLKYWQWVTSKELDKGNPWSVCCQLSKNHQKKTSW